MELCQGHGVAAEHLATVLKTFSPSDITLEIISPHPLAVLLNVVLHFLQPSPLTYDRLQKPLSPVQKHLVSPRRFIHEQVSSGLLQCC